jgi:hypothetical protein
MNMLENAPTLSSCIVGVRTCNDTGGTDLTPLVLGALAFLVIVALIIGIAVRRGRGRR